MKRYTVATTIGLILSGHVMAESAPERISGDQALNICALAIPLVKQYVVIYEKTYEQRHGLAVRIEYAPMSDSGITATGQGILLNYRLHYSPSMESVFMGPYLRYRKVSGSGVVAGTAFDFTIPEFTVGLNFGKRWVWQNGVDVVMAIGYGKVLGSNTETLSSSSAAINAALTTFKNNNSAFINAPLYGEFSIGYVF